MGRDFANGSRLPFSLIGTEKAHPAVQIRNSSYQGFGPLEAEIIP